MVTLARRVGASPAQLALLVACLGLAAYAGFFLLGDPALRARLAHNGRALVERRYDWSAIRADVSAAYAWLGQ